jgi:hypothetical protein
MSPSSLEAVAELDEAPGQSQEPESEPYVEDVQHVMPPFGRSVRGVRLAFAGYRAL